MVAGTSGEAACLVVVLGLVLPWESRQCWGQWRQGGLLRLCPFLRAEVCLGRRRGGVPVRWLEGEAKRGSAGVCYLFRVRFGKGIATWLILPVVICLSQRLSHACVSINSFVL